MWSLLIISVLFALCVSATCSLCEAALLSLTPGELEDFAEKFPRRAQVWKRFKEHIEEPIAVILILNTGAHTIGATVAGAQFSQLVGSGDLYLTIFSIVFTFLMLQYTEILPKTLGVTFNTTVAYHMTQPLQFLVWALRPVVAFLHFMNKPFEPRDRGDEADTMDEISALVRLASFTKLIDKNQERILKETSRLTDRTAREVMIPVDQITFISTSQDIPHAIIAAHMDPHTRFPLREGDDSDHILGYINFKELVASATMNRNVRDVQDIARTVHFVDENETLTNVLKLFVNLHAHIAVVRNAAGKTLGMITMEDIVEELVGELEDEFDLLPQSFNRLTGKAFVLGGGVPTKKVFDELDVGWHIGADTPTISSWMLKQFGQLPHPGDHFDYHGWNFIARRIRRGQIFEVTILPDVE